MAEVGCRDQGLSAASAIEPVECDLSPPDSNQTQRALGPSPPPPLLGARRPVLRAVGAMHTAIEFPNMGLRLLSAVIHFVGACVLTFVLARRTAFENLDTFRGWRELG